MASSLSNLVNNASEGIHRNKCKFGHVETNISIAAVFFNTRILKMI